VQEEGGGGDPPATWYNILDIGFVLILRTKSKRYQNPPSRGIFLTWIRKIQGEIVRQRDKEKDREKGRRGNYECHFPHMLCSGILVCKSFPVSKERENEGWGSGERNFINSLHLPFSFFLSALPSPYSPPFSLFTPLFVFSLNPLNGCLLVSIEIARVRDFNLLDKVQNKCRRKKNICF
jgi:hypothetical protein